MKKKQKKNETGQPVSNEELIHEIWKDNFASFFILCLSQSTEQLNRIAQKLKDEVNCLDESQGYRDGYAIGVKMREHIKSSDILEDHIEKMAKESGVANPFDRVGPGRKVVITDMHLVAR